MKDTPDSSASSHCRRTGLLRVLDILFLTVYVPACCGELALAVGVERLARIVELASLAHLD